MNGLRAIGILLLILLVSTIGFSFSFVDGYDHGSYVNSVAWTDDGSFLAAGGAAGTSGMNIRVFGFDGSSLTLVDNHVYGTRARTLDWHPSGQYLAVGGYGPMTGDEIQVLSFNGSNLGYVATADYGSEVVSVKWHPSGQYLAIGGNSPTNGMEVKIYSFSNPILALVDQYDPGAVVMSVSWSPTGEYLALGLSGGSGKSVEVLAFDGSSLSSIETFNSGGNINSVNFSPDGSCLAAGGSTGSTGDEIFLLLFDPEQTSGSRLSLIASRNFDNTLTLTWTATDNYLIAGRVDFPSGPELEILSFDGISLTSYDTLELGANCYSVDLPDNACWIGIGRFTVSGDEILVYEFKSDLGDTVWLDSNLNGIQDDGAAGVEGAVVLLYDDTGTYLNTAVTDSAGHYSFPDWCPGEYQLQFIPPSGYTITAADQGSDDSLDSDASPLDGRTSTFWLLEGTAVTSADAGLVPGCPAPDETIWIYEVSPGPEPDNFPVLNFQDPNQPAQRTGYNVYRSSDPGLPHESWPLLGSNIVDMDESSSNLQYTDSSGDTGDWYYQVAAYSEACDAEGPW